MSHFVITILRFVEDSLPSVAKIVKRVEDHCLSMTSYSLQIPYLDNFLFSTPQREETWSGNTLRIFFLPRMSETPISRESINREFQSRQFLTFLSKLGPKIKYAKLNVLDRKYTFRAKLVKKFKIICLSRNLVPRLTEILKWCLPLLF